MVEMEAVVAPSPEAAEALRAAREAAVENAVTARLAESYRDKVLRLVPNPERMAVKVADALLEAIGYTGPERRKYHGPERRLHLVGFHVERRRRA